MRSKLSFHVIVAMTLMCAMAMVSCRNDAITHTASPRVSFKADLVPIFSAHCAINSSCHADANSGNDEVNLDSASAYNSIINRHLVSSTPESSLLYEQVSTGIMPMAPYPPLSNSQVTMIYNWIKQGANNN